MSSYPSNILNKYSDINKWFTKTIEQPVSVANGTGNGGKRKIEVLTANYDLTNPYKEILLF